MIIMLCSLSGIGLAVSAYYYHPLLELLQRLRRHTHRHTSPGIETAAITPPLPPINSALIVACGAGIGGGLWLGLVGLTANPWWLLSLPFTCGIGILISLFAHNQRQSQRINQQITMAAAEVAAAMNSGQSLNAALKATGVGLAQPLATPWRWMTEVAGSSITQADGQQRFLQMKDTAHFVAARTRQHYIRRFFEHIEACADLPHASARNRLQAVSSALYHHHIQAQQVRARMAHARGSALIVLAVGGGLGLFLRLSMAERWQTAFSSSSGGLATLCFSLLFSAPLVGIMVLSRAPELDF